jgi:hypothetical protein
LIWVWLDGEDLRQAPFVERKKKLKELIKSSECSEMRYAQHVEAVGKLLFEEVCERNLEGIIAVHTVYSEHGWLKIKNPRYTQAEGRKDGTKDRFHAECCWLDACVVCGQMAGMASSIRQTGPSPNKGPSDLTKA